MSMTYAQLTANIEDICETSFTSDQLSMFTQQAEQKIYNSVQLPALRKNVTEIYFSPAGALSMIFLSSDSTKTSLLQWIGDPNRTILGVPDRVT